MADRIKGITVEIGGDTTGLSKALSGVNKEIRNTQSQLKDVNRLLKLDPANTILLAQKQKLLKDAVGETKDKLEQLKSVQEQMDAGLKNGTLTQQQYDAWQREIIATEQELEKFEEQVKSSDSAVSATLKETGSKLQDVGGKISGVGESLTKGVTAPIAAIGAASLAAFSEVDEGLDIVTQKTGASGQALEEMQSIVKSLATEIPTDFATAGAAVGEVNTRFGLTGQALSELSGKFIKFAQLNNTDVSTSVDNVSSVLNAFGQSTDDAGSLLDALNATGQSTGISMDQLARGLSSNAAQFKEMGLSAEEAVGFMGMVEMSGLDTSAAMMGLKTAMKSAAADGKSLDEALQGFSDTMNSNQSETEKLQAAYDLFGTRAGAAIYNAVQTGKLNLEDLSGMLGDFSGSVENTFSETLDPIDQFQMTMNSLKETGADIGNSLAAVLAPVLERISEGLKRFSEVWQSIPAPAQQTLVTIALIAAALGPLLIVIGKVVSAVGTIMTNMPAIAGAITKVKTVMSSLNATLLANPITLIVAGIGTLVAAFLHLWNTSESFRTSILSTWNQIKEAFSAFESGIIERLNALGLNFTSFGQLISAIWNGFTQLLAPVFQGAFQAIAAILQGALHVLTGIFDIFTGLFTGNWSTVWNGIKEVFSGVWTAISGIFSSVWATIQGMVNTVLGWFGATWESVWNGIKSFFEGIWNGIAGFFSGIWNAITGTVSGALSAISGTVSSVFNGIKSTAFSIWNGIKSTITGVINGIKSGISTVFNGIKSTVTSVFNGIKSTATSVWNGIKTAITSPIEAAKNTIKGIVDSIKGFFSGLHISLPKIKLPHFSISGGFSIIPPRVPHLSISWYKEGGIMTNPTLFGMNGSSLMAGGEAGPEAILPLEGFYKELRSILTSQLNTEGMEKYLAVIAANSSKGIYLEDGTLIGKLLPVIDQKLGQEQKWNARLSL